MINSLKMCCRAAKPLCLSRQMFADVGITIFAAVLPCILLFHLGTPVNRGFFCEDNELKYPYVGDTVSVVAVMGATLITPLITALLAEASRLVTSPQQDCSLVRAVRSYWAYFYGFVVLQIIIQILKLTTGELRPFFMDICQPDVMKANCSGVKNDWLLCRRTGKVNERKVHHGLHCTNDNASQGLLLEARQSFPSGHAAMAFYCSVFLTLYLEDRVTASGCRLLKLTLQAAMLIMSLWCSATRISDHNHHRRDVVVGTLLGFILAVAMFYKLTRPFLRAHDDVADTTEKHNTITNNCDVDLEIGEPETPTPLLSKNGILISSNTGMHIGPFRLQRDRTESGECI
ncbi:phospholipid phosphatase 1-like [Pomacea canaliculata]|uniref:phospholipid phosphatase 1-like n=1 Tax=Pomacea canaliculata TaxID=400727 RepID=UPI000D726254|nr:phospholipid phosphatase 1-like [Pomacea canaliculata]